MALGVYIGRFEPLHNAHLAVMLEALREVERLAVVLGSAGAARSVRNPFTAGERAEFIGSALAEAGTDLARVHFAAVPDVYDLPLWAELVRKAVGPLAGSAEVVLFGHEKDASSAYLREFAEWRFVPTRVRSTLGATEVRQALFQQNWTAALASVPPGVAAFLRRFAQTPAFAALCEEAAFLSRWQAAWSGVPAPPSFVAAHALVAGGERVLAVRRPTPPGQGLWMLPGGLLSTPRALLHDSLQEALQREVTAQTGWSLPAGLPAPHVFDHPDRSLLGREVAYVYPAGERALPSTFAGTLETALWQASEALAQPGAWYGDHHHILQRMLNAGGGPRRPHR